MSLIDKLRDEYRISDPDLKGTVDTVIKKLEEWMPKTELEKDSSSRETAVRTTCTMLTQYRHHILERKLLEFIAAKDTSYKTADEVSRNMSLWMKEADEFAKQYKFSPVYSELVGIILRAAAKGTLKHLLDKLTKTPPPNKPSIREQINKATTHFKNNPGIMQDIIKYVEETDLNTEEGNALYAIAQAKNPTPDEAKYVLGKKWLNRTYTSPTGQVIDNILSRINRIMHPRAIPEELTPSEKELARFKNKIINADGDERKVQTICKQTAYHLETKYGIK